MNKITIVEEFIKLFHEYNYNQQQQRIKLTTTNDKEEDDNDEDGNTKPLTIPMLSSICIPSKNIPFSALLQDTVFKSKKFPNKKSIFYKRYGDCRNECTLRNNFKWKSKKACLKYSHQEKKLKWMKTLPKLISSDKNED